MRKKTIGIIGAGNHFAKKIFPVISNSNFYQIGGILRKSNRTFKNIPNLNENEFFKRSFDFVYICCPNNFHEKYILKSLKSNFHVLCEKPFIIKKKKI